MGISGQEIVSFGRASSQNKQKDQRESVFNYLGFQWETCLSFNF
jgi:hypothetical protein